MWRTPCMSHGQYRSSVLHMCKSAPVSQRRSPQRFIMLQQNLVFNLWRWNGSIRCNLRWNAASCCDRYCFIAHFFGWSFHLFVFFSVVLFCSCCCEVLCDYINKIYLLTFAWKADRTSCQSFHWTGACGRHNMQHVTEVQIQGTCVFPLYATFYFTTFLWQL